MWEIENDDNSRIEWRRTATSPLPWRKVFSLAAMITARKPLPHDGDIEPEHGRIGYLTCHSAGRRMSGMAETYSSKLSAITLPDPEGKTTRLGSLWESGPAVLVFLRHYG